MLPHLHLVTDDGVLGAPGFASRAQAVLLAHGDAVALHLRGHATHGAVLFRLARELAFAANAAGAGVTLLVNDRVDVALVAGADGVQLGRRSLPIADARGLLGADAWIGYSAHDEAEATAAAAQGASFVLFGTVYATPSHAERSPAGVERLRSVAADVDVPLLAIGGITPERAAQLRAVGAYGVAVLSGVWRAPDPEAAAQAVAEYRSALGL